MRLTRFLLQARRTEPETETGIESGAVPGAVNSAQNAGIGHEAYRLRELVCRRGQPGLRRPFSCDLPPGRALRVLGKNGSGKTSFLNCLAGLLPFDGGWIESYVAPGVVPGSISGSISGAPSRKLADLRARCHYVGERPGLKEALTVRQNLEFWYRCLRSPTQAQTHSKASSTAETRRQNERQNELLAFWNLRAVRDHRVRELSAGQRQRASLLRLMLAPRPVWLLDEPEKNLDSDGRAKLVDVLRDFLKNGGILVVVSHLELQLPSQSSLHLARDAPRCISPYEEKNHGTLA